MSNYIYEIIIIFCILIYLYITFKIYTNRFFLKKKKIIKQNINHNYTGYVILIFDNMLSYEIEIVKEIYNLAIKKQNVIFIDIKENNNIKAIEILKKLKINQFPAVFYIENNKSIELFDFDNDFLYETSFENRKKGIESKLNGRLANDLSN
ncbi:hypothetical protein PQ460_20355 [Paenibacillus sp. KACC 21273]|uniref:hypothetical protein n=1 Tax=Paenibacillus sp. KACC 21273 TaxID=3025665 RepID=UPI0023664B17|nr:hypothetical protein [Paenibacillus sp. KACC 21273]WDF50310.1 hypothetical protein PQ460_20355 [Paenibacillus sp. KACC 21273]